MMDRVCARLGCNQSLAGYRIDALWCSEACRMVARRTGQAGQTPGEPQWVRFLRMLRAAGPRGVHTFDMRRAYMGNPSQRKADLELRGCRLRVGPTERLHGKNRGVRYFLEFEPAGTSPGSASTSAAPYLADEAAYRTDPSALSPAHDAEPDETPGALFSHPAQQHRPGNAIDSEAA